MIEENLINTYGLPGIIIVVLSSVVIFLYRENQRLHGRLETLLRQVIEGENQTRIVLEKVVDGLNIQDQLTKYLEKITRTND